MKIKENVPIVLFDNQCYLCMKFANTINFFARGKITMVGHYSQFGEEIRKNILDESALEMFWFINQKRAYGGRAALLPLIKSILSKKTKKSSMLKKSGICKICKSDYQQ
jgi:predicted DCC family thiol-disulfide oxidoreductase YuxK